MKYQTKDTGYREAVIQDFGGLDRAAALCGGSTAFDVRNFRRMKDGSLKRRGGLVPLATFGEDIRGAISILRNGAYETYAVAGQTVYTIEEKDGAFSVAPIAAIASTEGEVTFLEHDGQLILLDGEQFLSLSPDAAIPTEGYIPLYGDGWDSFETQDRAICERPNLLSRRLRIKVRMHADGYYVYLSPLHPVSVDAVMVNGEVYPKTFLLNTSENRVEVSGALTAGDEVELYLTMPSDFAPMQSNLKCARRACALGRAEDARIMFYDFPETSAVRISRAISPEQQRAVRGVMPHVCMIYLTQQDEMVVGDGIHAVTGGCRHYDRSLIFTAKGSFMADGQVNEDGSLRLIPVNTGMGCTRCGSVAVAGNEPYTVFTAGLLRWTSETDERNECNAEVVSYSVHPLMDADFERKTALWADGRRGEIWCYTPGEEKRIWVYQTSLGCWTSFDGFCPRLVVDLGGEPGIVMGGTLYRMRDDADRDTIVSEGYPAGEERGIDAEYRSTFLDFGAPDRTKRVCRASLTGVYPERGVTLTLQRVDGRQQRSVLKGDGNEISQKSCRVNIGRFRFVRVGVRCDAYGPLHLYQVRLETPSGE